MKIDIGLIQAVVFDLDGTLIDSEIVSKACWEKVASGYGLSLTDFYHSLVGKGVRQAEEILKSQWGAEFPATEARLQKDRLFDRWVETRGLSLKAGAIEVLSRARKKGYKTALATSSPREIARSRTKSHALESFFDVEVYGDEVTNGKPDPESFLLAAQRLGIDPERCLVLEDSNPGVEAALRANMHVIMIPDIVPPESPIREAGIVISDSLESVLTLVGW